MCHRYLVSDTSSHITQLEEGLGDHTSPSLDIFLETLFKIHVRQLDVRGKIAFTSLDLGKLHDLASVMLACDRRLPQPCLIIVSKSNSCMALFSTEA